VGMFASHAVGSLSVFFCAEITPTVIRWVAGRHRTRRRVPGHRLVSQESYQLCLALASGTGCGGMLGESLTGFYPDSSQESREQGVAGVQEMWQ
jgi:hypothetical protein